MNDKQQYHYEREEYNVNGVNNEKKKRKKNNKESSS